jgi:cytidylate kinase
MKMVIAIDGPAASGKSSVARRLARLLGFNYVNSGTIYRAVTWELLRQQVDPARTESVEAAIGRISIDCGFTEKGESFVRVNSYIPDVELRGIEVNQNVSAVSAIPAVRRLIVNRLRALTEQHNVVMEGRDIGTAVFPDTPFKFYLDAHPDVRRKRRAAEGQEDSIEQRDKIDSTRSEAPLAIAPNACVVDTSHLTLDGVVEAISGNLKKSGLMPE